MRMNSLADSKLPHPDTYITGGFWESELNPDNILGMKGEVARAYGHLMDRIWNGNQSVTTPREFKQTLSKFAPAFSGWQQHDSQELIAFLLDGLHEDLNRIKEKPYEEVPDWNGGDEKDELELANLSWEIYKRRNDSVIVDLFQGQLRNRLICPECGKVRWILIDSGSCDADTCCPRSLSSSIPSCILVWQSHRPRSGAEMYILYLSILRDLK